MLLALALAATTAHANPSGLVVHEWGTFTSVAGHHGTALDWRPLSADSDLPGFVYTIENPEPGVRRPPTVEEVRGKGETVARVRMETPVLYFYADRPTHVDVSVGFPEGQITEWYPRAMSLDQGIDWGTFLVQPHTPAPLPVDATDRDNHYYAARNVGADLVRVCDERGSEHERFLFYRGVGDFGLPLTVTLDGSRLTVKNTGADAIGHIVVFDSDGTDAGFRVVDLSRGPVTLDRPTRDDRIDHVVAALEKELEAAGLYRDEARAMTDTWRSSWFEEGLRVLYLVPAPQTDAILPLSVSPQPSELVRVLVGRIEVLTPELTADVHDALRQMGDVGEEATLERLTARHGRFAEPAIRDLRATTGDRTIYANAGALLERLGD